MRAQRKESGVAEMRDQMGLLKDMGIQMDPMAQLSGLVQLVNSANAPAIQQGQFGREMDLRELTAGQNQQYQQGMLGNDTRRLDQSQQNADRTFGLQQGEAGLNERKFGFTKEQFGKGLEQRKQEQLFDILGMLFGAASNPSGAGAFNLQEGLGVAGQVGQQTGLQGFDKLWSPGKQGQQIGDWDAMVQKENNQLQRRK